ncbi:MULTISPECIES: acyl-ACP--UDP-N-acetylglucosamine O-acyltransferase [unclassified Serratia (in: enterobacteria)]|uniref:acyl-ACP--UDP-N-acetylglucosamine O-acyltransferase n=1 Tax=unclassified Serratia (in: enterobacteria) TaxID=2647522 RepID=UPI0030766914
MLISSSAHIARGSVIEPGAVIGAQVYIGPFCVITAGVEIGEGTVIASHVVINGQTRIGRNNSIGRYSSIGEVNQDLKYAGEATDVVIGDRNHIGEKATIHRGTVQGRGRTAIGHDNRILNSVHIGHDCVIGNGTLIGNNSGLAGHVELDDAVQIGVMCAIHQFCILGAYAQIADRSGVVQDVPPFVCASGNHALPTGFNQWAVAFLAADIQQQQEIRTLYDRIYHLAMPFDEAKKEAARLAIHYLLLRLFNQFFSRSTRGIIR